MTQIDYRHYKVLLVDDDLNNLKSMIFAFELEYNLTTALNASEALSVIQENDIAVVLSDQRMPDVPGSELLKQIKNSHPGIVRILITAYADIKAAVSAVNDGNIYRYISKDISMDEISAIIKQAIEYYKMQQDLEAATQALIKSEKLVTIAEMAAGIGHEIKNTLTGINLGLDNLIEEMRIKKIDTDPDINYLLVKTKEYAKRSNEIVARLNDFAKPGHVEFVNLYKIIDDSIEMAKDGLKGKLRGIEIIKDMHDGIPAIHGNYVHFEEIFLNLIRNACQAMEGMEGKITIKGETDKTTVRIAVEDTGPGIPKENLKRVFGAFYTTKKDGMGMGLYIIDNIVKTFGGRLDLESELGKGSRFTAVFPMPTPGRKSDDKTTGG
ncbi:MAG: hybrid sensor histidine kinase/response regulator [Pseudomonadota bacterium]